MLYRGNSIEGSNPSLSVFKKPARGPAFYWPFRIVSQWLLPKIWRLEINLHGSAAMLILRSTEAAAHIILGSLLSWGVENGFGTVVLHQVTNLA